MLDYQGMEILPGDIVEVINGDTLRGEIRKVEKLHHSGLLAYVEPDNRRGEKSSELYFVSKNLRLVKRRQIEPKYDRYY